MNSGQSYRLCYKEVKPDDHSGPLWRIIYESVTQTGRNTNNCTIAVTEEIKLVAFETELNIFMKRII